MSKKAVLGLSGGVDSAAAALLLSEEFDVTCVFLHNGLSRADAEEAAARSVSESLGLPFRRVDVARELESLVIAPFLADYAAGRTPSPCVLCNPRVKFRALLSAAEAIGAETVATGHYARTERHPSGITLLRDTGTARDQSYMLCRLPPETLARCRFPLAGREKEEIRALCAASGLSVAAKPDSMELCFVPEDDHAAFSEARGVRPPPGEFVDAEGRVLGTHRGVHHYTVGQRKGLGIALGAPAYVLRIDAAQNRVVLGFQGEEYAREIALTDCVFHLSPQAPFRAEARVRYSRKSFACTVCPEAEGRARAVFDDPVRAPAPGQFAVFYENGYLTGSGRIEEEKK